MLMEAGLVDCLTDMVQDSCKFTFNNIIFCGSNIFFFLASKVAGWGWKIPFFESGKISTCRRIVYGSLGAVSL